MSSKLTAQDVADIRAEHRPRVVTAKHLAERYGVSEGAIRDILSWRTWAPKGRSSRQPQSPSPLIRAGGCIHYLAGSECA